MAELGSDSAALLERAEQAHREGRFAQVRALLRELGRRTLPAAEQQRVTALRDRLRPDPFVALLLLACLILFASVVRGFWR